MKKEILVDMVLCLIMCISCGKSTSESSTAELTVTESGQEVSEVENDEPSVASSSVKQIENTGNGSVSDVTTVEDKEQYSSTKDGKKPAASSDPAIAQTLEEDEFIIEEDDMPADENKPGTSEVKAPDESKTKKTDPSSKENGTAAPSVRQTDYTDNLVLPEDTNF
ncbi:MAG: hypothetical protein K6A81_09555 [Clostridiales bacterium]|nr:hypothetical protein [Clostridiales bacterium]